MTASEINHSAIVETLGNKLEKAIELAKIQEEYINLLGEELNELATLAHTHGWKSSRIEKGKKLRQKIKEIKGE